MAVNFKACSVEGCNKPHYGRGWCSVHWSRWRRHGDPLAGRTFDGEPLRYLLETVLTYEGDECLIWPYARDNHGVARMYDGKRMKSVPRIVCEKVHGPAIPPSIHAAHSCGRGHLACVTKRHLRWATVSENQMDRVDHGTSNRGEQQGQSKLTAAKVKAIRSMIGTTPLSDIARHFDVDPSTIHNIKSRKRWGWLE